MEETTVATYPRPDFTREDLVWQTLSGPWSFAFDDKDVGLQESWHRDGIPDTPKRSITVPYVFQAPASGIHEAGVHEVLWYQRDIEDSRDVTARERGDRILVRFGAVDYEATVWVGGLFVGSHRGGHVPFEVDVTDTLEMGEAKASGGALDDATRRLTVRVFDSATDVTQPRGKQFWGPNPEGIFYTPSSGIWQDVWMESVPATRIGDSGQGTILKSDDIEEGSLHALIAVLGRRAGQRYTVEIEAGFGGSVITRTDRVEVPVTKSVAIEVPMRLNSQQMEGLPEPVKQAAPLEDTRFWLNGIALWSPEAPQLYTLTIRLYNSTNNCIDQVHTTAGMRSITWFHSDGTLRLNGHPYFHALVLDQGYWPETLMTPPSSSACKLDIEMAKAMGFNGCRKHQKVEDPAFMYWADRLGFMVWGEMASAYQFSKAYVERFDEEWMAMVKRDINHPSIVAWTLANESWGYGGLMEESEQRNHLRSLYYQTKTLDPTRPINDNCGWEHVLTDLSTFHDYADALDLSLRCSTIPAILSRGRALFLPPLSAQNNDPGSTHRTGVPILCTEFGGVNIAAGPENRDTYHESGWGYTTARNADDLLERIEKLCLAVVKAGHVCGFVWTQLTDIEQETNGLYTYDRREKLPARKVKAVMETAAQTYLSQHRSTNSTVVFRAGLRESCRNIRLEDERYLLAECALDSQGKEWLSSRLDLNDCLTNSWGRLSWARGGNFKASSRSVRLVEGGLAVEAEAGDGKGWVSNKVRLEERIRNRGGRLMFV